jgi:hypothetical protein
VAFFTSRLGTIKATLTVASVKSNALTLSAINLSGEVVVDFPEAKTAETSFALKRTTYLSVIF